MKGSGSVFGAMLIIGLIVMVIMTWAARYKECRAHGFSEFYCATAR